MRNRFARIREGPHDLRCRMDPQELQITVTVVHDAMGQSGGHEAGTYGSRFRLNSGAVRQGAAFENRDLSAAAAAVHGARGSGWKRGRAHRERRAIHAPASDHQPGLDTVAPGKGRDRRIRNDRCFS